MLVEIINKLNSADCVGIFSHVNPDGDALGSAYSLREVLRASGKRAEVFLCNGWNPVEYELTHASDRPEFGAEECDLLVALDCAGLDRLGEWSGMFSAHNNTAAIDHHITHVPFAGTTEVQNISSTCELMLKLYKEMGAQLTREAATDLYIGMATDTGCFKYSSVTGDTMRAAAELIDSGVDFAGLAKRLFDTVTKEYIALQRRALSAIKYFCGGRVAMLMLTNTDFAECGTDEAAASAIVTLPASIEGVELGIYIRQRDEDEYKVSLRSVKDIDVAAVAKSFGGGGHIRAAGYSVAKKELDDNLKKLMAEAERQLSN